MALIGLLILNTDTRKMFVTFDPKTGYIGVIAVGFVGLNEICFVPYEKLTYVTDIISSMEMGAQTYHVHQLSAPSTWNFLTASICSPIVVSLLWLTLVFRIAPSATSQATYKLTVAKSSTCGILVVIYWRKC
jgi:hypothetical protein